MKNNMGKVIEYTNQKYSTVYAYSGVAQIKRQLLKESAIVVNDDDENYMGIITPYDLLLKPHNLVIDCMRPNISAIDCEMDLSDVLDIMNEEEIDALPVFKSREFYGLILRDDILSSLSLQNNLLREEIINKDKFFSIIAHDLRNPLNYISGFSEILKRNFKTYDDAKKEYYIDKIEYGAKQLVDLTENLLDWAMAQKNKLEASPEQICLKGIMDEKRLHFSPIAAKKNISINNHIDEPACVFADTNMVKTVFRNLLSNAIKFTRENGKIDAYATVLTDYIEVSITDDGIGIPKDRIEKLFGSNDSISTVGTQNETGTGLGLALCREFIELNGGKIWVDASFDVGCCVKFTLPLRKN